MICKWIRFGYKVLPWSVWRAFLLQRHLDHCLLCQSKTLDDESIRAMGIKAAALQAELPLWPVPAAHPKPQALRLSWSYAFGLSLVAAMVWLAVEMARFIPSPASTTPKGWIQEIEASDESRTFAVLTAKIGAEQARAVIFKPQQPGLTIVWFEKINN